MKICAISDLHGHLPDIPPCDLLLIAGDICPLTSVTQARIWLDTTFRQWLNNIPATNVVATWGNHDFIGQYNHFIPGDLRWSCLVDDLKVVEGVKIWGSPYQLPFHYWAFNLPEEELEVKYSRIPEDVDIIISHGPPYGYGDLTYRESKYVGSKSLRNRIFELRPKLVVFGHIHEGYGEWLVKGIRLANVSILDQEYQRVNPVYEYELS